ncbi:hypothetical protein L873DRAFT_1797287 [Choiromyces venosus 120613-1]|uniref:Histone-lysine N-methyltransferase, H3 lysine-36 specific n=1 Tax=Choiromyces venosus 120613-1 TaxID=1336337 RepID=A0A3N4K5E1_9PEZI|nr:hypothetical protein L873DRAFT_1797287 [Choiromyces venosus 120613-1]
MIAEATNGSPSPGSGEVGNIHLDDSPKSSSAGVGKSSKMAVPDEPTTRDSGGSSKSSSRGNTPASQVSEASVKQENGTPPRKPQRAAPRKSARKPPTLFADYPDSTKEATSTFTVIEECIYSTKSIGDSGQDGEVMSCDCKGEWDGDENIACGDNSDCINRMTSMECTQDDRTCGQDCRNQRFQKREYADVSVIKTEKKGFGLRANYDIPANTFLYEYVGEVINEARFRKRMEKYSEEGIKHFYFMSLGKNEFIDATKKGGLARFCNHSCNPNCFIDKWVVGEKLRMGIFTKRDVVAGEELVFDYNVDRYGTEPQTCYCGETNCLGYIGGRTQTYGAAPKLSHHIIEALGLEDNEEWSTATVKKGRRPKKTDGDDEDYVESVQSKPLGESDVTKVMSSLLHCKEKWIVNKLLHRIQLSEDEAVPARVVKMHGYQIMGKILHDYQSDENIVLMALDILMKFPRITKNKITSSKIEPTVQQLSTVEDQRVQEASKALLEVWSSLETGFRIPRRSKADMERTRSMYQAYERESSSKSKSNSPQLDKPLTPNGPNRPRAFAKSGFQNQPPRGPRAEQFQRHNDKPRRDIPWGWHKAHTGDGKFYYYSNDGRARWEIPQETCTSDARLPHPPPPPPRTGEYPSRPEYPRPTEHFIPQDQKRIALQAIIDDITRTRSTAKLNKQEQERQKEEERVRQAEKEADSKRAKEMLKEKEKAQREAERVKPPKIYDDEKTRKILMRTFSTVVANAVNKYESQIGGRDLVKKHAKDITELLVKKEMKDGRQIANPHLLLESDNKRLKVKGFVKPYIEKVIRNNKLSMDNRKREKQKSSSGNPRPESSSSSEKKKEVVASGSSLVPPVAMNPMGDGVGTSVSTPMIGTTLLTTHGKRRREEAEEAEEAGGMPAMVVENEGGEPKRPRPSPPKDMTTPPPPTSVTEVTIS